MFAPKPCCCSCGGNLIIEEPEQPAASCCREAKGTTAKPGIKEIKVLGTGCAKCKTTCQTIGKVIRKNGLDVKLTKIEDIAEIMAYNIIATPAVVVDGIVKIKGRVPSESEIKELLGI